MDPVLTFLATCVPTEGGALAGVMALFVSGLVSGFLHCGLMCGPLALSLDPTSRRGFLDMLGFHAGRITTYLILAFLFSLAAGKIFDWLPLAQLLIGPMILLAAFLVLSSVWPQLGRLISLPRLMAASPLRPFVDHLSGTAFTLRGPGRAALLGFAAGFMPCGMTLGILIGVAAVSEPSFALLAMAAFGLGTSLGLTIVVPAVRAGLARIQFFNHHSSGLAALLSVWMAALVGYVLI